MNLAPSCVDEFTAILQESQLIQVLVVDQANSYKNHACSLQIRYVSMVFPVHILFEPSDDTKSLVFFETKNWIS